MIKTSLALLATALSLNTASATQIYATYAGTHISPKKMVELDVHRTQQALGRYLTEQLGCTNVKLCLGNFLPHEPRLFRTIPGSYHLTLTADCRANFENFSFDMNTADDYEDYTDSVVGYFQNGNWIEHDIVARPNGEDYRQARSIISVQGCDSSPIDTSLPYRTITNPNQARRLQR